MSVAREYWIETLEGMDVSGPYQSEQDAKEAKQDHQDEWTGKLIITNSNDSY